MAGARPVFPFSGSGFRGGHVFGTNIEGRRLIGRSGELLLGGSFRVHGVTDLPKPFSHIGGTGIGLKGKDVAEPEVVGAEARVEFEADATGAAIFGTIPTMFEQGFEKQHGTQRV